MEGKDDDATDEHSGVGTDEHTGEWTDDDLVLRLILLVLSDFQSSTPFDHSNSQKVDLQLVCAKDDPNWSSPRQERLFIFDTYVVSAEKAIFQRDHLRWE